MKKKKTESEMMSEIFDIIDNLEKNDFNYFIQTIFGKKLFICYLKNQKIINRYFDVSIFARINKKQT